MTIDSYINNINQRYKLGSVTEYTFRGDLQQILESLVQSIRSTLQATSNDGNAKIQKFSFNK